MKRSTLVHAIAENDCISFQTVNRTGRSPHRFYILRKDLAELERKPEIIVRDIHSFAILSRDDSAGTAKIAFTWLNSDGHNVSGYQENVILPYGKLAAFIHNNAHDEWKTLSIDNSWRRPQIAFESRKNLHAALQDRNIRRKLVRCLRDGFRWPDSERIEFYDDFLPYSFVFHEIREGKTAMVGGLILHRQEDMEKAYYSIHT